MIGVTIGIGEGWREVAGVAARQMELMTGLECLVIDDGVNFGTVTHPSWMKCLLAKNFPQHSEFLVFDADVICVRPWDPKALFVSMGRNFCAVPEENHVPVLVECHNFRLPFPDWYVNGGLLMFGREHQPVWDEVWAKHPEYGSWLEQTALNEALRGHEVARLPRIYNSMLHGDRNAALEKRKTAVNVHADSFGGKWMEVRKLQQMLIGA
jgi:hypothetical protein